MKTLGVQIKLSTIIENPAEAGFFVDAQDRASCHDLARDTRLVPAAVPVGMGYILYPLAARL
jgi:hypothetical protein